jgi:hypothetical protein
MSFVSYLYHAPVLSVLQMGFTIWMLVDAHRRGMEYYWFFLILIFQPFGAWAYFFLFKVKDFRDGHEWLGNLLHRPPSLQELRHRFESQQTTASRLDLAQRLVELQEYAEAVPHLEAVLGREPEHCQALFALAECRRGLGHPEQAIEPLRKLIHRHSSWQDYRAWQELASVLKESGDAEGSVNTCRELARIAPSLQHKYLLAEQLVDTGATSEARKTLELALEDFRYLTGPSRRRDRRWVGRAKQLLKAMG